MLTQADDPVSLASATHACKLFYATQGIILCKNCNKQSDEVIWRLNRLRTAHSKSKKSYE